MASICSFSFHFLWWKLQPTAREELRLLTTSLQGTASSHNHSRAWKLSFPSRDFRWNHSLSQHLNCDLVRDPEIQDPVKTFRLIHSLPTKIGIINAAVERHWFLHSFVTQQSLTITVSGRLEEHRENAYNCFSLLLECCFSSGILFHSYLSLPSHFACY